MLKKLIVLFLFASLCLSQAFVFRTEPAAANVEMTELVAMLPESDVALMFDVERIITVAAPEMLNNDPKKLGNLLKLLKSVENQIGVSPLEIRHIALGLKLGSTGKFPASFEEFASQSNFTAIIRTKNSNAEFLDAWTKRLDVIMAFKEEQAPAQKYMNAFKAFRDFKSTEVTPEKIADATAKFQASLAKTQAIEKTLNAIPKTAANRTAVNGLLQKNRDTAKTINDFLAIIKTDADMKIFRETSVKLLNRYNNISVDDPQRAMKLNQIVQESKVIHPAFYKKYKDAQTLENFFAPIYMTMLTTANMFTEIDAKLEAISEQLGSLPAAPLKRSQALVEISDVFDELKSATAANLSALASDPEMDIYSSYSPESINAPAPVKPPTSSINETLKTAQREVTVNNKKMLVIDFNKFDEPEPATTTETTQMKASKDDAPAATAKPKPPMPNLAVGYLDDRTMVVGTETSINQFLRRDANYKNEKAIEMLASSKNPLVAFATNSNIAKALSNNAPAAGEANLPAPVPIPVPNSTFTNFFQDVNFYGSINYDGGNVTNDVTMSLGMFKDQTTELNVNAPAENSSEAADNTFQFGDSLISSSIFYDLLGSFKAIQASLTFKFDKKKIARLVRQTPRIIDGMISKDERKENPAADKQAKPTAQNPRKLETLEDLLTAPEVYLNLARLFSSQES